MAKYREKPVEIEAHRFTGSSTSVGQIKNWIETGVFRHTEIETRDCGRTLDIPTLEGLMTATAGDMIIKGLAGEFYPCKPDIFAESYELVEAGDRQPGEFEAKNIVAGDVVAYCGSNYAIVKVESFSDSTKLTLEDKTTIEIRPWTILTVVSTGA